MDERLNRSDVRADSETGAVKDGVLLKLNLLTLGVSNTGCTPLVGATVDVWHCDALGVYSDIAAAGPQSAGQNFLRGYQVSDGNGAAQFTTIYPGWYQGRAVHIHFKVRTADGPTGSKSLTSQLYFDDALSDQVFTRQPYATRGQRSTRNASDGIYRTGGSQLTLQLTPDGAGYATTYAVGLQL